MYSISTCLLVGLLRNKIRIKKKKRSLKLERSDFTAVVYKKKKMISLWRELKLKKKVANRCTCYTVVEYNMLSDRSG